MERERVLESDAPEATEALAEALGRELVAGDVVALEGELGSGKTCFVRGLARGLGIEATVTSPTYTLMQSYDAADGARVPLEHYDAYMEGRERAFLLDGGCEGIGGEAVSVIEWAERVRDLLPEPHLVVRLAHLGAAGDGARAPHDGGPGRRRVELEVVGQGPRAEELRALIRSLSPAEAG